MSVGVIAQVLLHGPWGYVHDILAPQCALTRINVLSNDKLLELFVKRHNAAMLINIMPLQLVH